jgi:hypothetical protein
MAVPVGRRPRHRANLCLSRHELDGPKRRARPGRIQHGLLPPLRRRLSRVDAAAWIAWSCDGPVVEVYRDKNNHAHPTLVVDDRGLRKRFQPVDFGLFNEAKAGQRLYKPSGTSRAMLDGKRVLMAPRQVEWRHEPWASS